MPEQKHSFDFDDEQYAKFKKIDNAEYDRVNGLLRDRVYFTAREWAIARLCSDFRTGTGVKVTQIGENLPDLVPFMTDQYTPQAVQQARVAFEDKVRKSAATFLYGGLCDFFTADELDDVLYEGTEIARFLIEVEGATIDVDHEGRRERQMKTAMEEVREASVALRHDRCPHCGEVLDDSS